MLNGKVILITGASGGSRATALLAAQNHAQVIVNYQKNTEQAERLVTEITALGLSATAIQTDVAKEEEVRCSGVSGNSTDGWIFSSITLVS